MSKTALFVGLGSIGKRHLKNLKNILGGSIEVDALRSSSKRVPDEEVAKLIRTEYYNIEDLPNYDMIFITNPSNMHYETIFKLQNKTDNFFIEKPLDVLPLTDEQISKLDLKKIYYIACPLRHTGVYKELEKILKDKKIYSVRAICTSYLPDWRKGVDYRTVYSAKKESGGVKIDLIHEFDYLFRLLGFPKKYVMFENKISDLEIESNDFVSFTGEYDDKYLELHLDYFGRIPQRTAEFYTKDDVIWCDFNNSKIRLNDQIKDFSEEINDRYINEIKYFLNLIDFKNENINDMMNANRVLKYITQGDNNGIKG